jgi:O-antigen ligase
MAVWNYRERFFPVLLLTFLCAGTAVPLHDACTTARWGVLAVGAIAGFALYMKSPSHSFGTFHLMALFSVVTALVSALVSNYPRVALLKALSLLLVFLYGAAGARLAVVGREAKFFSGLLIACEILVYVSAFSYFVLRLPLYGNPNSLGVVMGVVAFPLLLWGIIVSEGTRSYKRLIFALGLCVMLLLSSYARAAIGAVGLSSVVLCIALRRYRLLMKGGAMALLGALLLVTISPSPQVHSGGGLMDRLSDTFVYKGTRQQGIFESRETPWELTSAAIQTHPWFGTGFGTSVTSLEARQQDFSVRSTRGAMREHGNSYLAVAEWSLQLLPQFRDSLPGTSNFERTP